MTDKSGKRICDRCGAELTERSIKDNPHDMIALGWVKNGGIVTNTRYDICKGCADAFDLWMEDAKRT